MALFSTYKSSNAKTAATLSKPTSSVGLGAALAGAAGASLAAGKSSIPGFSSAYNTKFSSTYLPYGPRINAPKPSSPINIRSYNPWDTPITRALQSSIANAKTSSPASSNNQSSYTNIGQAAVDAAQAGAKLATQNIPEPPPPPQPVSQPSYSRTPIYTPEPSYQPQVQEPLSTPESSALEMNNLREFSTTDFAPPPAPATPQPVYNPYSAPIFNPYDEQLKALKSRIDEINRGFEDSLKPSSEEQETDKKLKDINAQLQNIAASRELGVAQILERPIALQFQTGQIANLQRQATAQATALEAQTVPLRDQLARLQAERQNRSEINKYQLGNLQSEYQNLQEQFKPRTMEVDGNIIEYTPGTGQYRTIYSRPQPIEEFKPIQVSSGATLVDPRTGKVIYSSPVSAERDRVTDDIAEFNLARKDGYKGTFVDFKRDLANLKETGSAPNLPAAYRTYQLSQEDPGFAHYLNKGTNGPSASSGLTQSGLSSSQIKQIESSPEAKKLQSLKDLKNKLQAYREVAAQPAGFDIYGSRKATLDSLYADLKIAYKDAAGLGALTGPDLTILSEAIKPMSGISNLAGYLTSGGQKGVLNSIDQAVKAAQKAADTNYNTLLSKYRGYQSDPYIQNLGQGLITPSGGRGDSLDSVLDNLGFKQPLSMGLNGSIKAQAAQAFPTGTKGGQCGVFAHKLVQFPAVGDGKLDKFKSVNKFGVQANQWRQNPQVGDVLITDENPTYGHVAVVNEILPNGTVRLSESNFRGKETVSHDRVVSINSPKIYGAIRGKLKV